MTAHNQGPRCRACKATEARCARVAGCCGSACTHWRGWTSDGEPIPAVDARQVDAVTARRRELWRERYYRRRAS